ncbi:9767_t:CDS:2 [Ambispora leptoticha]|uniref:9767_t:CDS:1 n=1 Tax=Ambispora leptoticha TaxID=144679 RepID=A0A9N9FD85_9GLOM|nr:9767_t:CDS:2 [Ambispora leptoticha]
MASHCELTIFEHGMIVGLSKSNHGPLLIILGDHLFCLAVKSYEYS